MHFINKLNHFLKKEDTQGLHPLGEVLYQGQKDPGNARSHLKLAEIYQKKGEKKRAISEYLLAAEMFARTNQYAEAMALYKQVPKQDPSLDHIYLKIADIYRKMGFLADAFAQYRILVNHYDTLGRQDKALEIMGLMSEIDLRQIDWDEKDQNFGGILEEGARNEFSEFKAGSQEAIFKKGELKNFFDLKEELEMGIPISLEGGKEVSTSEKAYGTKELLEELKRVNESSWAYPDFHYHMGEAYGEMGFLDGAIEQFQLALEKGQKPFEAAFLLGLLFQKQNRWNEACSVLERALGIKGTPEEKRLEAKYELHLVYKELGKTEEALGLLREISAMNQEFLTGKDGFVPPFHKPDSWKNRPNLETGG